MFMASLDFSALLYLMLIKSFGGLILVQQTLQCLFFRKQNRRIRELLNDTVTESLEASLSASGAQISF